MNLKIDKWLILLAVAMLWCIPVKSQSMLEEVSYEDLETLINTAKENYPKIHAMSKQVDIANVEITSAKLGWFKPLSIMYYYTPSWSWAGTDDRFFMFNGFQFGIMLNVGTLLQTPSEIKKAKLFKDFAELNGEEYVLSLTKEVKNRYYALIGAKNMLNVRMKASIDAATLQKDMNFRYQKGEVSFEDLIKYNSDVTQHSIDRIIAEQDYLTSVANLEELIGVPLDTVIKIQLHNGDN
ncbi:TolC family protein [Olivibacter sitiensis]|uniref:TolC family protein n=1 Tax=Olivibacter sitiensis TaxID=376470 RepID=UPI0003FC89C0|nr:TolC family protein [Olivibacter sitiensis]